MKVRAIAAVAAALALGGCSSQTTGTPTSETAASAATSSSVPSSSATSSSATSSSATSSAEAVTTTSAAPASPAAAPAPGETPTREFVIGKWGTDGDCELAIDLRADGTSDGPFGDWTYNDGVISFVEEPDFQVAVTVIDENTMESTNSSSEKTTQMTRCP